MRCTTLSNAQVSRVSWRTTTTTAPLSIFVQQRGQQPSIGPLPPSPAYALYTNGAIDIPHYPGHHSLPSAPRAPPPEHHVPLSIAAEPTYAPVAPSCSTGVAGQYDTCRISMAAVTDEMRGQSEIYLNLKLSSSSVYFQISSTVAKFAIPIINPNLIKPPPTPDQTNGGPTVGSPDSSPTDGNGTVVSQPPDPW